MKSAQCLENQAKRHCLLPLRTSIPVLPQNLKPQPPQDHLIRSADQNTKKSYSDGYNKRHGTTPLSQLKPGDPVLMKSDAEKTWSRSGTVVASDDRTYLVNTPMGVVRRNRKHLQLLPSPQSTAGESPQPRAEGSPESTAGGCSQSMAQVGGDSQSTVGEDSHASSSTTNGEMTLPTQIPEEAVPPPPPPTPLSSHYNTRSSKGYKAKKPIRFREDEGRIT